MTRESLRQFFAVAVNLENDLRKLHQELLEAESVLSALRVDVQHLNRRVLGQRSGQFLKEIPVSDFKKTRLLSSKRVVLMRSPERRTDARLRTICAEMAAANDNERVLLLEELRQLVDEKAQRLKRSAARLFLKGEHTPGERRSTDVTKPYSCEKEIEGEDTGT